MSDSQNKTGYILSLDGLRALAVILVLGYHFRVPFFNGGFLGVDIFFVLSGYLITTILLNEWNNTKTIDIKKFWIKRLKRLYPAVIVLIIVVTAYVAFMMPSKLTSLLKDDLAAMLSLSNWWYIVQEIPYADFFSDPTPLKHIWSLSVEGQFYLLYPLIFLGLYKYLKRKRYVFYGIFTLFLFSAIEMMLLFSSSGMDRVYYGTDTRIFGILIGALFAFVWPYARLNKNPNHTTKVILNVVGTVAFLFILLFCFTLNEYTPFLYRGGFVLISGIVCLLLGIVVHPGSAWSRLFSHPILGWIGKRSYSIYLWHFPIIELTTPLRMNGMYRGILSVAQLFLTFVLADLSYRFIENVFRKKHQTDVLSSFILQLIKQKQALFKLTILLVCSVLMIFTTNYYFNAEIVNQEKAREKIATSDKAKNDSSKQEINKPQINDILIIGDSVILGAKDELEKRFPGITVDAKVGRQLNEAKDIIEKSYKKNLNSHNLIIVALGSNGTFTKKELDDLLNYISDSQIVLINTKVPRNWEGQVNSMLSEAANNKKNTMLIDWYKEISNNYSLLEEDGVHLTSDGSIFFVNLIEDTLNHYFTLELSPREETSQTSTEEKDEGKIKVVDDASEKKTSDSSEKK